MAKTSKPSLAKTHPMIAAEALGWNPFKKSVVQELSCGGRDADVNISENCYSRIERGKVYYGDNQQGGFTCLTATRLPQ